MKIYDLSPEISEGMAVYKNKPEKKPAIKITRTIKDGANESRLEIDLHTGSHVDAPYHIFKNGKKIGIMNIENFMGNCIVFDFTNVKNSIRDFHCSDAVKRMKGASIKGKIILLRTKKREDKNFDFRFVYLDKSGADYLASNNVKAVGIDSLGLERNQPAHDSHKILLRKNIPVFEGLNLGRIRKGEYFFCGLPLKIKDGDGSPVRAVLIGLDKQ